MIGSGHAKMSHPDVAETMPRDHSIFAGRMRREAKGRPAPRPMAGPPRIVSDSCKAGQNFATEIPHFAHVTGST